MNCKKLPTKEEAERLQKVIENLLDVNGLHYRVECVKSPELAYINIAISIKVGGSAMIN